jgi:hypothetical protein
MDPFLIAIITIFVVWGYAMAYIITNRGVALPFKALLWKIKQIGRGR